MRNTVSIQYGGDGARGRGKREYELYKRMSRLSCAVRSQPSPSYSSMTRADTLRDRNLDVLLGANKQEATKRCVTTRQLGTLGKVNP
jgi:hypothetical protein